MMNKLYVVFICCNISNKALINGSLVFTSLDVGPSYLYPDASAL